MDIGKKEKEEEEKEEEEEEEEEKEKEEKGKTTTTTTKNPFSLPRIFAGESLSTLTEWFRQGAELNDVEQVAVVRAFQNFPRRYETDVAFKRNPGYASIFICGRYTYVSYDNNDNNKNNNKCIVYSV